MKSLLKHLFVPLALGLFLACFSLPAFPCTTTSYSGLTAAIVNPTTTVTGPVDATGCDIGVYFDNGKGSIDKADISKALQFGVFVNGDTNNVAVDIRDSSIHEIGDTIFSGNQRGVAIYYRAYYLTGSASGTISGNQITNYQKAGIVANGQGTSVVITDNTVTGHGPTAVIAQNGIQVGYGASATVMRNTVSGNSYSGTTGYASGGVLVLGGSGYGNCPDGNPCPYTTGLRIVGNTVTGNDVGVWLSNFDSSGNAPASATNIKVVNNILTDDLVTNGIPFQAGVLAVGKNDKIINNTISGYGYDPSSISGSTFSIYEYGTVTKVHANTLDGVRVP